MQIISLISRNISQIIMKDSIDEKEKDLGNYYIVFEESATEK